MKKTIVVLFLVSQIIACSTTNNDNSLNPGNLDGELISIISYGEYQYWGEDMQARFPYKVYYGYTDVYAVEFASASNQDLIPWYKNLDSEEVGNFESEITYTGQNYTFYSNELKVASSGNGILYRLGYKCRNYNDFYDCGESEVKYKPVVVPYTIEWAGNINFQSYHREYVNYGDINPLTISLLAPGSELAYYLKVEVYIPGVTDNNLIPEERIAPLANSLIKAYSYENLHTLTPDGELDFVPVQFIARWGNNYLYNWDIDNVLYDPAQPFPEVGSYIYKIAFINADKDVYTDIDSIYWLGTEAGSDGGDYRTVIVDD